ncbi:MAG: class II aldolase/adducin family protein [Erysipelotrichaceae bacterium]|nr:class II aldolase/adducin family protein [Erysipelotrichaceae bacterium]
MQSKFNKIIWVAHQLYDRKLVTGTTGNISFKDDGYIYISQSGSCFGLLDQSSFAKLNINKDIIDGKPSKEYPLHLDLYNVSEANQVVIHTHSYYSTIVSCLKNEELIKGLFAYSPYLRMNTGGLVKKIGYQNPGSIELFAEFNAAVDKDTKVYILSNHGIVITAKDIIEAFNLIEEFETSAKMLIEIKKFNENDFGTISKL